MKPGDTIGGGRYRLDAPLGDRDATSVFRGWDDEFRRPVVVKLCAPSAARTAHWRPRFLAEARAMADIDHPNVVRLLDVGEEDGLFFIVTELAEGGSLADLVRLRGPRPAREALCHVLHALRGLHRAHQRDLVHRDVKPQNMLLWESLEDGSPRYDLFATSPIVKLADFGIAKNLALTGVRLTRSADTLGTLAYMSTEQRDDPRNVGPASDVYGVGATLYFLLTGRRPFDLLVAATDPTVLERLPPPCRPIVARATAAAMGDRYPTARDMALAVAAALGEDASAAG